MRIAVGGMIASGKSTLAAKLAEHYKIPVIEEFTKDDEVFSTLLKWLYEGKPNVEILLQIYFIHNQWLKHKELQDNYIVDRDVIEHWIFAQINLRKLPEVLNMYNGLFHAYMNSIKLPDMYIILDVDFEEFEERIKKRGRPEEIANYEKNKEYFEELWTDYTERLLAQCIIHDVKYRVIKTTGMSEEKVLREAIDFIWAEM